MGMKVNECVLSFILPQKGGWMTRQLSFKGGMKINLISRTMMRIVLPLPL